MPPVPSMDGSTGPGAIVEVRRGDTLESSHRIHVAVVDAEGALVARAGDAVRTVYLRSAAKPFQALPLVEDGVADALGLTPAELALCCASHNGERAHVDGVRGILAKAGLGEDALGCGPSPPLLETAARWLASAGTEPGAIHNNCSGKHAGMLALAVHNGWSSDGYLEPGHPVQRRALRETARWSGVAEDAVATGTDGCGVVCFALPLRAMGRAFARFAVAAGRGEEGPARIVEAMARHPFMVAGTKRLCTAMMEVAGDRVVVKAGAEGLYCGLVRSGSRRGLGIALKVEDGAGRAADVALVRVVELLSVLTRDELDGALASFRRPPVRNTRGEMVGEVVGAFDLETSA